jgi:predicted O-methyltransferase YrrM
MNIDKSNCIIQRLFAVSDSNEGSLYNNHDTDIDIQTDFIAAAITLAEPKRILEIGTHKGFFCHFVLSRWPNIVVDTCDIADFSERAIAILREVMPGATINYYHVDSNLLSKHYHEKPDLAWVDGYHSSAQVYDDLGLMAQLGVGTILVDDCGGHLTQNGLFRFCLANGKYRLDAMSADARKICLLRLTDGD